MKAALFLPFGFAMVLPNQPVSVDDVSTNNDIEDSPTAQNPFEGNFNAFGSSQKETNPFDSILNAPEDDDMVDLVIPSYGEPGSESIETIFAPRVEDHGSNLYQPTELGTTNSFDSANELDFYHGISTVPSHDSATSVPDRRVKTPRKYSPGIWSRLIGPNPREIQKQLDSMQGIPASAPIPLLETPAEGNPSVDSPLRVNTAELDVTQTPKNTPIKDLKRKAGRIGNTLRNRVTEGSPKNIPESFKDELSGSFA